MRSTRGKFRWRRASIFDLLAPEFDDTSSLNEIGTVIILPSNSGRATFIAVSMGPKPSSLSSHSLSLPVLNMPWMMGMFSLSR